MKILTILMISLIAGLPAHGATCGNKLEDIFATNMFINDVIFLEKAATQFYDFNILSPDLVSRLNSAIEEPENLEFIQDSVNLIILENWFLNTVKNQTPSKAYLKLMNTILGTRVEYTEVQKSKVNFPLSFSTDALKSLQTLENTRTAVKVKRALSLLEVDPSIPTLQTHKLDRIKAPGGVTAFTSYIDAFNYRLLWYYGPTPGEITVMSIIPHKDYRRLEAMTAH